MPNTSPEKVVTPAASDAYALTADLATMGRSMRTVVYVANQTERAAVVAGLTAAGTPVTASRPLYVHRGDAAAGRRLESTDDGTNWRTHVGATPVAPDAAEFTNPGYAASLSSTTPSMLPGLEQTITASAGMLARCEVGLPAVDIPAGAGAILYMSRTVGAATSIVAGGNYALGGGAFGAIPVTLVDSYRVPTSGAQTITWRVNGYSVGTVVIRAHDSIVPVTMRASASY